MSDLSKTGSAVRVLSLTSLLLSVLLTQANAATPLRKMTLITPYNTHNPGMVTIYAAEGLGFFSQEGIELSIELSKGTGDSGALLAAGKGEFAVTGTDVLMTLASKGADVVSTFVLCQGELNKLVVLEDSPIKEMTDLKGKNVGIPFLGTTAQYVLVGELKLSGMNADSVNMIPVGVGPGAIEYLIQQKVDALITPSYGTAMYISQSRGIKMRVIPMKAKPTPTHILATTNKTLNSERNTVIGMARAMAKGIVYTMANSSAAIDIMGKLHPELVADRASVEFNTNYLMTQIISEEGKKNPIGWHDPEVLSDARTRYEEVGIIPKGVVVQNCYTNELLKEINSFDRSAVERMAQSGSTKSGEGTFWDARSAALLALTLLVSVVVAVVIIRKFGRSHSRTSS